MKIFLTELYMDIMGSMSFERVSFLYSLLRWIGAGLTIGTVGGLAKYFLDKKEKEEEDEKEGRGLETKGKGIAVLRITALIVIVLVFILLVCIYVSNIFKTQEIELPQEDYKYVGQVSNKKPHGYGAIYNERDEAVRVGHFRNGVMEGYGEEFGWAKTYDPEKAGTNYWRYTKAKGEYICDKYDGEIELHDVINNMELVTYKGQCRGGVRFGKGISYDYYPNGRIRSILDGYRVNNKADGFAEYTYYYDDADSTVKVKYKGNMYDSYYFGLGLLQINEENNEVVYSGYFSYGNYSGLGILYDKNGNIIRQGTFKEDGTCDEFVVSDSDVWAFPEETIW
ncbi:MAG: hypothetical protein K5770_12115 [Lachnospiraceae bacterium]|nr:hypothetical protein [Lachnospiraceae bacterium]